MATKIILVDDHHVFRAGLRAIISHIPGFAIVGEAADARSAYAVIAAAKPDVVILDLVLPDGDGIAVTREIRRRVPEVRVLALTMQQTQALVPRVLAAGALGFALKSDDPDEILRGLEEVAAGRRYVTPTMGPVAAQLMREQRDLPEDSDDPLAPLSRREREVCDLVLRGLSNQAIAAALYISIKTVETHRARINQKLGVHSTGQLIRLAALQGLISS